MRDIFRYVDQNRDRFMAELCALVRQPSISAQNVGVAECAAPSLAGTFPLVERLGAAEAVEQAGIVAENLAELVRDLK